MYPRVLPCGDSGLTVEFGETIDVSLNDQVMVLDAALRDLGSPVVETIPTYRSLFVSYDVMKADYRTVADLVLANCNVRSSVREEKRHWLVPVAYGGEFGIDLTEIAERHDLGVQELIRRHASVVYRVYMIGFMPGFAYLGGLDETLTTPRRATPRLSAPPGSITLGGAQTAITSIAAPCGWHILGRSPVRAFMPDREPACLFAAGDLVTFEPIPAGEWQGLSLAAHKGDPIARQIA